MLCRTVRRVCLPALPVRSWFAFHRVAEYAPTVLPLAQRALAWPSRAAPQSKDCVRARPAPATIPLRKGRSAAGAFSATVARLRAAVLGTSPLRHRRFTSLRDAPSIRECGLHGLVGIPPVALQGRLAAPAAPGRRIRFGPAPPLRHLARYSQSQFSRGARGAPYAARCAAVEPLWRQGAAAKLEASTAGRRAGLRVRSSPKARYAP